MESYVEKQLIHRPELSLYVRSMDEIDIYCEIFKLKTYEPKTKEDLVVIDIGMNVALASLYFAGLDNVKKVYGFEPFKFTYNCAVENISINPNLKSKIKPNNFGFSDKDKIVNGYINIELKGNSSTTREANPGDVVEKVKLKRASTVIKKIIRENPKLKVLIKMDCEGGEVEIFKDKAFVALLDNIKEIMMETHDLESYANISTILKSKGFTVDSKVISECNGYIKGFKE